MNTDRSIKPVRNFAFITNHLRSGGILQACSIPNQSQTVLAHCQYVDGPGNIQLPIKNTIYRRGKDRIIVRIISIHTVYKGFPAIL